LKAVASPKPPAGKPSESWKRKIGVEFSGLERPRDFVIAFAFLIAFILVAAVIAFVMFG
jgi:hypothetical protein